MVSFVTKDSSQNQLNREVEEEVWESPKHEPSEPLLEESGVVTFTGHSSVHPEDSTKL